MDLVRSIARPLLAGMFVAGGRDSFRNPDGKVGRAERVVVPILDALAVHADTATLVRVNGAVQMAAGSALAIGKWPRVAALALAGTLVPTTLAGHRFWEEQDPVMRATQRIHFLKNLSMLGGLLLAADDTGGRPSVPWRVKQKAAELRDTLEERVPQ